MARSLKRSFGFAAFGAPVLLVAALAGCGDDDDAGPGGTVAEIKPSTYVTVTTLATGATTLPGGAPTGEPGDTTMSEQTYEVQSGDFLSGIAADFEVEMDQIANFNNWADGTAHPLFPGDTVRIPPGAVIPAAADEEEEATDTTEEDSGSSNDDEATDTTEADEDPELCPDGEPRGHYTVKAGDFPGRVAASLDVTVTQLNEANTNTPGYSGFIVGIEINIPCGADIAATDTTEG